MKSLGADYAIDYKEEDFVKETLAITNGLDVHAVLDTERKCKQVTRSTCV